MATDTTLPRFTLDFHTMHSYNSHNNSGSHSGPPHFTDPWAASAQPSATSQQNGSQQPIYMTSHTSLDSVTLGIRPSQQQQQRRQSQHQHQLPQPARSSHYAHGHQLSPISQHHHNQSPSQSHQQAQRAPAQQPLPPAPQPQTHRPSGIGLPAGSVAFGAAPLTVTAPASGSLHGRTSVTDGPLFVGQRSGLFSMLTQPTPAQQQPQHQQQQQNPHQHQHHHQQQQQSQLNVATTTPGFTDPIATPAYSAPSPVHPPSSAYSTAGPTPYDQMGYVPASSFRAAQSAVSAAATATTFGMNTNTAAVDAVRRFSHPDSTQQMAASVASTTGSSSGSGGRRSFQDAIEASQGTAMSLSQDATPRPLPYGTNPDGGRSMRSSGDSYGFPATHSTSSSVSSQGFGYYNGGSMDSSATEYSTGGSDLECSSARATSNGAQRQSVSHSGRQGFLGTVQPPPAPQSMMSQFSSKMQSTAQKKHKCKVCDKRFTRPSSLQTHIYSHTGEKPFRCDYPYCGRHFSVVSNLRRHKKVHSKDGGPPSETGSEHLQGSPVSV